MQYGSGNFFQMAGNFCGGKVREAPGSNIVDPGLCRFAEALNFQFAHGFLLLKQAKSGTNDFTGIAESSITNTRLNKCFEVGREVDVLRWHHVKLQKLATIVNFEGARNAGDFLTE